MKKSNSCKDGIIGFILGDAIGVPYEFKNRELIDNVDMIGNGTHNVIKGTWSDDSSMVIATMDSIINNNGNLNYEDIMNNFLLWLKEGKFTNDNKAFDVGRTTYKAIINYYYNGKNALECGLNNFNDNGNGSLMRILPIAYYCYYKQIKEEDIYSIVKNISSLTHSHNISIMGCYIYVLLVIELLKGNDKNKSYDIIRNYNYNMIDDEVREYYKRILDTDISLLSSIDVKSSGYIVDTLETVIWCFLNNDNYNDSIINAIKLGDDTDTIGALVGGLCGIYYGYENINSNWLSSLRDIDMLLYLCSKFVISLHIE